MNQQIKVLVVVMTLWLLLLSDPVQAVINISELEYFTPDGTKTTIAATKPLTMLVVFKPDCQDCQAELPIVQSLAGKYAARLNIAFVVYGQPAGEIIDFYQQFRAISNISVYADPDKRSKPQFSIRYVPCIVFFDSHGQLLETMQADNGVIEQPVLETVINRYLAVSE